MMSQSDREWLERALDHWERAERDYLLLDPQPLPTVFVIGGTCTYRLPHGNTAEASAKAHGGTVTLPDGGEAPLGPISFASGGGDTAYFAMSLPSVWRKAGVTSKFGLERLMDGVLLHEIMHTRQSELLGALLDPLGAQAGIPDDELTDDVVQDLFGGDPDYVAAWEAERDLLFAAALAPDDAEARRLAAQALDRMRERRARWFTGDRAALAALDDIFLTMEGMGQWMIWRYFLSPEGGGYSPEEAMPEVRRGGRQWSQDEGLALILTVDRLLPDWRERAFRDPDWRAERLLAAAVGDRAE
jgi:hypothetical protein